MAANAVRQLRSPRSTDLAMSRVVRSYSGDRAGRPAPWRPAMERCLRFGRPRRVRSASGAHGGREQVEFSGAGVVPDEVEGPGAGGDALVVADPPGSVFPAGFRRAVRIEGRGGYLPRCPEAELVWLGQEQDLVHQPVREGEGGDADPACLVDG